MVTINIFGIDVNKLSDKSFLDFIAKSIKDKNKVTIGYANADTLNKIYSDKDLKAVYRTFDLIHPDGTGIYLASRILYGNNGLDKKLTGSDFYPLLINESINKNWSYFFFGHSDKILEEVKVQNPSLNISGVNEGYFFDNSKVIEKINKADPDIIIIGLSCPYQERWIFQNKDKIKFKVIIAVGDGIRVFAKNKIRGPIIIQKLGFEWLIRLASDPVTNFSRYVIGIPKFIFRIFKTKLKSI